MESKSDDQIHIPIPSQNYVINKNLENLLYDYKCDETKLQSMIDFISTITHITFDDLLYNMYEIAQTLLKENKDIVYKVVYDYSEIEGDKSAIFKQSNLWISLFFYHSKLLKMKYSYNNDIFYNYKNKFIEDDISKFIVGYDVKVGMDKCKIVKNNNNGTYDVLFEVNESPIETIHSSKIRTIENRKEDDISKFIVGYNAQVGLRKCKIVKNNNNGTYDVLFDVNESPIETIHSSKIRPIENRKEDDCIKNAEIDNLIIFDDMIYSGGQMLNKIIYLYLENYIYHLKTIYVCVPFISDKFVKKILENFWRLEYKDGVKIEEKLIKITILKEDPNYGTKKEVSIIFVFNEIIKSYLCLNTDLKPRIYFDHKLADIESIEIHRFQSNCPESDFYLIDGCNTVEKCPYPPYKKEKVENYLTPNQIKKKFDSFKKLTKKEIENIKKCRNCGEEKIKKFLLLKKKNCCSSCVISDGKSKRKSVLQNLHKLCRINIKSR